MASARENELSDFDKGVPKKSVRFRTKQEADVWRSTYTSAVQGFGSRVESGPGRLDTGFPAGDKTLELVHFHCTHLADHAVEAYRFRSTAENLALVVNLPKKGRK